MATVNLQNIRNEMCFALRNGDLFPIAVRGVTTTTDNFIATAGQTVFPLAHAGVKNIRIITVQAVNKYYLADYTCNFNTGVVTLNVGATLGDAVSVNYDYGTGDKIYPDYPRDDLDLESFPRCGIDIISNITDPFGLGGMTHISDFKVSVLVWMPANKVASVGGGLGGTIELANALTKARDIIRQAAKSFYSFKYIYPEVIGPMIKSTNNKIIQQNQDFEIKFLVET